MNCRFCQAPVSLPLIDLVNAPPSNAYLTEAQLDEPETYFPLAVFVCESCWLVQVDEYQKSDEIFTGDYAYYSSVSSSWLEHCKAYTQSMTARLGLTSASSVLEVASNDGYLLQYFVQAGIPALGVEPTAGTAAEARQKGVETLGAFWGTRTAREVLEQRGSFDLMLGNNVLAHVPDINDFVQGFAIALAPEGTLTFEFPHLLNLLRHNQFDTIYHEHFSYLSLIAVKAILEAHELCIYDVEELSTHGGSLRVFARRAEHKALAVSERVARVLDNERSAGLQGTDGYRGLQLAADGIRKDLLQFLGEQKRAGRTVAAYGAAAKGNTLLNYCGVKGTELIEYVVDRAPAKQDMFMPGSHIPIVAEPRLKETQPDFVLVLPWNILPEIREQLAYIREWDGKFVTCIPEVCVHE
ncbi:MAG: 2-polyprenyl-3-methyl-5-hydroxy-6-metoxy-1,4-benzoquinol methylase [Candidatus Paceibacteria bacterium]|jgi:2-polyprenyl-3-methyl-5-hydroxy-6-metoxy-1,4-benzoquinol methylase